MTNYDYIIIGAGSAFLEHLGSCLLSVQALNGTL